MNKKLVQILAGVMAAVMLLALMLSLLISTVHAASSSEIQDQFDNLEQEYEEQQETTSLKSANLELIEKVLRKHAGNRKAAAEELGISERTLYRKLKQMN
jgi:transcriptional regulator with PAS, ATPase and Fis domain